MLEAHTFLEIDSSRRSEFLVIVQTDGSLSLLWTGQRAFLFLCSTGWQHQADFKTSICRYVNSLGKTPEVSN